MEERDELLEEWVRDHWDHLVRGAQKYRGRATTAEDVVQEAFVLASARRDELKDEKKTREWLAGFVRNVGMKAWEKRARRQQLIQKRYHLLERDPPRRPDEILDDKQKKEVVERAIATLAQPQRKVVELKLDGLTYREIAEQLGMALRTVKSHRARALAALREVLEKEGFAVEW